MIIVKENGEKVKVKTTNGLSTISVSKEDAKKKADECANFFKKMKKKFGPKETNEKDI